MEPPVVPELRRRSSAEETSEPNPAKDGVVEEAVTPVQFFTSPPDTSCKDGHQLKSSVKNGNIWIWATVDLRKIIYIQYF